MIYTTEKKAKQYGFTHHGRYYGVPVWIALSDEPTVTAKFAPFNYLVELFSYMEELLSPLVRLEGGYQFWIGRPIE